MENKQIWSQNNLKGLIHEEDYGLSEESQDTEATTQCLLPA
jgi:hypothetical protein